MGLTQEQNYVQNLYAIGNFMVVIIKPKLRTLSGRSVELPKKQVDKDLLTREYRDWRREVVRRASYSCEKCGRKNVKLYADHIVERKDGGALYDLSNGMALCASCHSVKTIKERQKRFGLVTTHKPMR